MNSDVKFVEAAIINKVKLRLIDALWDSNSCPFKAQTLLVRILVSSQLIYKKIIFNKIVILCLKFENNGLKLS